MLNESENKMMSNDDVTFKAASGITYEFFFPGSGKWRSMTVRAETRQEAQEYWEANRVLVNPEPEEVKPEPVIEVEEEKVEE